MKHMYSLLILSALICSFNAHSMEATNNGTHDDYTLLKKEFNNSVELGDSTRALQEATRLKEFFNVNSNKQAHTALLKKAHLNKSLKFGIATLGMATLTTWALGFEVLMMAVEKSDHHIAYATDIGLAGLTAFCLFKTAQHSIKRYNLSEKNVFDDDKKWITEQLKSLKPSTTDVEFEKAIKKIKD